MIVVASAAPAFAASGPAQLTTLLPPSGRSSSTTLPVNISFLNTNTGSTGLTTVVVGFTPTMGEVAAADPTIEPSSSPGWAYLGTGGTAPQRTFSFTRAAGIDGAPDAIGTATTTLSIVVTVVPNLASLSAGQIAVTIVPAVGNATGASSVWT